MINKMRKFWGFKHKSLTAGVTLFLLTVSSHNALASQKNSVTKEEVKPLPVKATEVKSLNKNKAKAELVKARERFLERKAKDPFIYRNLNVPNQARQSKTPSNQGDSLNPNNLISATMNLPSGIRVDGIIIPKNKSLNPIAALRVPGEDLPLFVKKNDLVSISPANMQQQSNSNSWWNKETKEQEPYYLLIKSISENGVEVAPKKQPAKTYLLR